MIGRPPCHSFGASGPSIVSRIVRASRAESGELMIFGSETASSRGMRFAPGTDAQPGVSGSPGTMKSYGMPPDCMWLSLPHGPSGYTAPLHNVRWIRNWGGGYKSHEDAAWAAADFTVARRVLGTYAQERKS